MTERGKIWIIPNEDEIIQAEFERSVENGKSHTYCIQEFSDIYQLGLKFSEDDYQEAPCEMASSGHMVIKSEDEVSLVVCYLPERITDRQYNWLYQNSMLLSKYIQVCGYSLQVSNDGDSCFKEIHGIEEIMTEARKKNLLKKKGMGR